MPIYEYSCQSCGHEAEITHKISDPPATECPSCNKPSLTKLISAAGFRLKGSGWYETDFKSSGKKNLAGEGTDSKAKSEAPACGAGACPKCETTPSSPATTA